MLDGAHGSEIGWAWPAVVAFVTAATLAFAASPHRPRAGSATHAAARASAIAFGTGFACVTMAIATRWLRLGHGPFLTLFEILLSNLASLSLICLLVWWRRPQWRPSARFALPVLALLAAWLVVADPVDSVLPPTYETTLLWWHVALGKAFLGCALVATGLAGAILARAARSAMLDGAAWQVMRVALVFETLMLIVGAAWARDAWGRYWSWDPLETWAFVTWLALVGSLHARSAYRLTPRAGALAIVVVFALAFATFFGVPFVSTSPHQGAV